MSLEFFMRHLRSSTLRNVILRALLAWFIQFVNQLLLLLGDNSTTAAGSNGRLITVVVQHAHDIVSVGESAAKYV